MKLVIEIPEEYRSIFEDNRCKEKFDSLATNEFGYVLRKAFEKGTPLPKGHGRLIDADALCITTTNAFDIPVGYVSEFNLNQAQTVIEADKESEE